MESVNLANTSGRAAYFRQGILANLEYWQTWPEAKIEDIATFDQEHNVIVRAISFALDLDQTAWPGVYYTIKRFSSYMERRGYWSNWWPILDQALHTSQQVQDREAEVELSVLLAKLSFQRSHFSKTTHLYRHVIRLARSIGDDNNEARACSNLGYYYIEQGQWLRAEVLCGHALSLFQKINNDHGCAHTENHLGFLYSRQECWDQAQHHFERACNLWQEMNDNHGLMRGLTNLGGLFVRMEQPNEALVYLKKAQHLAKITGEEAELGKIYHSMGLAHILNDELEQAEEYTNQAERSFRKFSDPAGLAKVWDMRGAIAFYQNQQVTAISALEKALSLWRDLNNSIGELRTLLDIVEYELAWENRQQAAAHLAEIDQCIGRTLLEGQYRFLQPRLEKYRRALAE